MLCWRAVQEYQIGRLLWEVPAKLFLDVVQDLFVPDLELLECFVEGGVVVFSDRHGGLPVKVTMGLAVWEVEWWAGCTEGCGIQDGRRNRLVTERPWREGWIRRVQLALG